MAIEKEKLKKGIFLVLAMLALGLAVPFMMGDPGANYFMIELPNGEQVFAQVATLDPAETLRAATSDAATGLGLAGTTGRLKPGLSADVLLVDGDPLSDLNSLTRPIAIWAHGRLVQP